MNKVEKIKAEIKRRCNILKNIASPENKDYYDGKIEAYKETLDFLYSLEEPVSNDLEEAATSYARKQLSNPDYPTYNDEYEMECAFETGAQWQKEHLLKDAQDSDLPEIDREVIVLAKSLPEHEDSLLKVAFAHRPQEYWDGKNIATGEVTRYYPKRYDKGGWNQPDVVYWLDVELPKEEE